MEMNSKETGKRIPLLRKQKGLSQEELADKLNVRFNTVAKIECGLRRPSADSIVDLVNFFDYLIGCTLRKEYESGRIRTENEFNEMLERVLSDCKKN